MLIKSQPIAPLETIYEESGSFIASTVDIERQLNNQSYINETFNSLISSHTIPTINILQQKTNENQKKPPIEVRFRDGSKRFISPSLTNPTTMVTNRRKIFNSSHDNLTLNNQQINNGNFHAKHSKTPLVITIITADDLNEAGITPTISSSSSSDDSERSTIAVSLSKSSIDTVITVQDIRQGSIQRLPTTSSIKSVVSSSSINLNNTSANFLQHYQQQHTVTNNRLSSTSSQTSFTSTNDLSTNSSPKTIISSIQTPLINDENKKKLLINSNIISSSKQLTNETVNHINQPHTTLLSGGGSRSAFRPFHKLVGCSQQTFPITSQTSLIINDRSNYSPHHQQEIVSNIEHNHQNSTKILSQLPSTNINSYVTKPSYDTTILQQKKISETTTNPSTYINSLVEQLNLSNCQKQSFPSSNSTIKQTNNSLTVPNLFNISTNSGQNVSVANNSNMKWYNVTSNSIKEIPNLSKKYSGIPLRVTLPTGTPTHNQKLITKHDRALENRLLNAGLSPETVALYERILNIAENPSLSKISPSNVINQYLQNHFI
ncbi:unnamed protein product [Rotaria sp. Silwood1]|nr:unnamed protein product [Rotaria sp. Silwood1]